MDSKATISVQRRTTECQDKECDSYVDFREHALNTFDLE